MKEIQGSAEPTRRRSKLGTYALLASLLPILMLCVFVALYLILANAYSLTNYIPGLGTYGTQFALTISYLAYCPAVLGILGALTGIVLGGMSLSRKEGRKGLAITAIVLAVLFGTVMCAVTLLLTVMSRA